MDDVNYNIQNFFPGLKRVSDRIPTDFGGGSPLSKICIMAYMALEFNIRTYVEIGVYRGKSLFPMAYVAKMLGGKAYGIDAYDFETAKEYEVDPSVDRDVNEFLAGLDFSQMYNDVKNLQVELGVSDHSMIIKEDSRKAIQYFRENHIAIDMLHIDGNHDTQAVQADVDDYVPLIRDGGIIVVDDIHWESVRRVYRLLEQKYRFVFSDGYFAILIKEAPGKPDASVPTHHLDAIYSLAALTSQVEENSTVLVELKSRTNEQERSINTLIAHTDDQGKAILTLTTQLAEKEHSTHALVETIDKLVMQVNEKEKAFQDLTSHSAELEQAFQDLTSHSGELEQTFQKLTSHSFEKENQVEMLSRQLQELREYVSARDQHIIFQDSVISGIYQSTSWKVSRPIRAIKSLAQNIGDKARTLTGNSKKLISRPRSRKKVSVIVTAYNHERYIAQCLDSILMQKGSFQLEIILGDDCSTDGTTGIMARYRKSHPKLIRMMPNGSNLGITKNLERCLDACSGDYIAICEGDDYWLDEYKLQKQIELLENHPDFSMCFSSFLLLYEEEEKFVPFEPQTRLTKEAITTEDLIEENYIGNFSCCMYKAQTIRNLPKGIYDVYTVDWMFNMACGEQGQIGFIKEPLSVYRKHSNGTWSGKTELDQIDTVLSLLDTYNKLMDGKYEAHFTKRKAHLNAFKKRILKINELSTMGGDVSCPPSTNTALNQVISGLRGTNDFESNLNRTYPVELLVLDTIFPHPLSPFRFQEFISYLDYFPSSLVLTTGEHLPAFKESRGISEIVEAFEKEHSGYAGRTIAAEHEIDCYSAKLAYAIFLNNIHLFLDALEKKQIPFVFTLYPGGGFKLNEPDSDAKLRKVLGSAQFRKVIVTQKITYDYLIDKNFCSPEQIKFIYGVVTPLEILKDYNHKRFYGYDKDVLDICFVAHKYMKAGIDKGYDLFIAAARQLTSEFDNVHFHVVGDFNETDIPVDGLEGKLTFYGHRNQAWFDDFYRDKDIILSPNKPFILLPGTFDGFPTASCTEAGLRKVAIFCTDDLNLNTKFTDGKDIVIIPTNTSKIVDIITHYHAHPADLTAIAQNGCARIQEVYNYENQIVPRIQILEKVLKTRIDDAR